RDSGGSSSSPTGRSLPRAGSYVTAGCARMSGVDGHVVAELAIARLQRAYADISTRKAWSEFAALATPDARFSFDTRSGEPIEVVGTDQFAAFGAAATDRFAFYEYVPLNFVADIDP